MSKDERLMPLESPEDLSTGEPRRVAGGIPAVTSTMKHAIDKMGLVRGTRTLLKLNQIAGFDCPGCAWPDPEHRTITEFCENGAKAVADEATTRKADPEFWARHSISELLEESDHSINRRGRITHPMVVKPGSDHYEPISWDAAFELIADTLNGLDSPDEAVFYTSGRTSNEAAFLYQLMVREYGTNNLPDCSNMCHESSGVGLGETIGIGKGTVLLEDFDVTDAIFVIGQNPGTNHPRMLTALQTAKRNGATIVSINPLRETGLTAFKHPQEVTKLLGSGTPIADLFLQVRINGDVALLKGIMKAMLERERADGGVLDREFIEARCEGFEAFETDLDKSDWEAIVEASGIERAQIEEAARIACEADSLIACWAMGLTQHKNGVANIQEVVNFLLMRGQIGRPGAGACPVRGHSNVQGDRTVGIIESPSEAFLDRLADYFAIEPAREHGYDTVHALQALHEGQAKVFFGMGGNFLSATPDTEYTAEAMRRCELTVQVSTKPNRAHLVHGKTALILPCLGRTEIDIQESGPQFVTVENSMGIVHSSRGGNKPASEHLLSEPAIVCRLARALTPESPIDWEAMMGNYDEARDAIEACVPGFDDYNERVRTPNGFALPNGPREGEFPTDTGRAKFTVHAIPEHALEDGEYLMMTIRSHDQYNTTIYGLDDRYRGIYGGRRVVMMNQADISQAGLEEGAAVDLVSTYDGVERRAEQFVIVPYDIPRRSVGTYFPEANAVVPVDQFADRSHTPISKSVVITLEPRNS